jgi:threonine dehydratase
MPPKSHRQLSSRGARGLRWLASESSSSWPAALTILSRLIETALVADGRLARFTATISDRPGGLAKLTSVIADAGASVKEITHDRTFSGPNVAAVNVLCTVETRDHEHIAALYEKLTAAGIRHFAHVGTQD